MKFFLINITVGIILFILTLIVFDEMNLALNIEILFLMIMLYLKMQHIEDRLNRLNKQLKFRQHRNPQQKQK